MRRTEHTLCFAVVFAGAIAISTLAMAQSKSKAKYQEVPVTNGGTVTGVVSYAGPQPKVRMLKTTKDQNVCGNEIAAEDLVVHDGKLQWVVVSIEGIAKGKPLPKENILLNNKSCRFEPHVQTAVTKVKVAVMSEDPVLHNTHAYVGRRTLWNMAIPVQNKKIPKRLPRRPGVVEVKCDAHEWMHAWIAVFNHPYYDTTQEDGKFTIADIPPGTYTVKAWHETLGTLSKEVTVPEGKTVTVNFEFTPK